MFLIILALIIGADRQTIGQSALVLRRVKVWRNEERLFNMAASADVIEMRAAIVLAE